MREAIERFVAACHPEIKWVTVLPVWLAKIIAALTRREALRFVSRLINYFDKVGEIGDPTEAYDLLGAPGTTLDAWFATQHQYVREPRTCFA